VHQGAEYLLAVVLIATGLQSPEPVWPAIGGGIVLANAAFSGPPLGAFRLIGRPLHRRTDLAVIAALVVLAALPWLTIDAASRLAMLLVAVVLAVVWWSTNFTAAGQRRASATPTGRLDSEHVGRTAGRLWVKAGDVVRRRQDG
jgi:hypothetical protein